MKTSTDFFQIFCAISVHKKAAKKHPAQGFGKICLMTTRSTVHKSFYGKRPFDIKVFFRAMEEDLCVHKRRPFDTKVIFRDMEEDLCVHGRRPLCLSFSFGTDGTRDLCVLASPLGPMAHAVCVS